MQRQPGSTPRLIPGKPRHIQKAPIETRPHSPSALAPGFTFTNKFHPSCYAPPGRKPITDDLLAGDAQALADRVIVQRHVAQDLGELACRHAGGLRDLAKRCNADLRKNERDTGMPVVPDGKQEG